MTEKLRACHYTSAQGVISIIQNHTLWASSAAFMNDTDEMLTGARAFSNEFERRRSEFTEDEIEHVVQSGIVTGTSVFRNFLLAAAKDPDSLTLWRNYGVSEVAYSVELDPSVELVPLAARPEDKHPTPPSNFYTPEPDDFTQEGVPLYFNPDPNWVLCLGGAWRDVSYIDGENDPHIADQLDGVIAKFRAHRGSALGFPMYAVSNSPLDFLKDRGFADEQEVRSVHWVQPWWKFVKYRPSRFGVVPYIEVTGREHIVENEGWAKKASKLPIIAVTLGPNAPSFAEEALRELLASCGYGDVLVKRSKTPYR